MITGDKVYPSKKGFIIYVVIALLIIIEISYFFHNLYLPAIVCLALTGVIVFPIVFNTCYTISNNILKVKSGFLLNRSIPIESIKKIVPCHTILSAPALSFDRLEVFYNKYDSVVISPVKKDDFIADLQKINPAIEYINKADE
ncbi:PH domain-containing protein [Mucilaginibacter aquariorum]|uniref:PH domain-containing protein n=1 Tax=Mucilaginibacter aquariorum TaxID=2967225 RepID=A0ABT1SZW4_9SPHI|nr:PH domain-containing protein [Mucilaginibacter aquariorum]MCQ6957872.1 PH domain-containing protein [Mucilaginibacter aquariorum]